MIRINEQDELLLNRLLDDDLSAEEAVSIQERMTREPALREAMDTLTRIDSLLSHRGADQPDINWSRFRQDVLDQVEHASRPMPLRFTRSIWLGAPLAAAAAIALLLVTFYHPTQHAQPTLPMARNTGQKSIVPIVAKPNEDTLLVRFNRPNFAAKPDVIQVRYKQSTQLAESMRKRDHGYRSRPTVHMYIAERPTPNSDWLQELSSSM